MYVKVTTCGWLTGRNQKSTATSRGQWTAVSETKGPGQETQRTGRETQRAGQETQQAGQENKRSGQKDRIGTSEEEVVGGGREGEGAVLHCFR